MTQLSKYKYVIIKNATGSATRKRDHPIEN